MNAVSFAFENLPSIADIVLASDKHQRDTLRQQISEFGSTLADLKVQLGGLPQNHTLRHKYDPSIEQMQEAHAELDLTMELFCNSHGQIPIKLSHPSHKQEIAVFSRLRELHRRFITLAGLPAKPVNEHMRISVPELKKALVSKESEGASPTEIALLRDTLSQIEKLRGYLFQANIAFAISRLSKHLPHYKDRPHRDDLEQAAFLGMVKAIDDLDLNRGTKFVSYAGYHIMNELYDALKILAPPKDVRVYNNLDKPCDDDQSSAIGNIPDPRTPSPVKASIASERRALAMDALNRIQGADPQQTERFKMILAMRYGLDTGEEKDHVQIAEALRITVERAKLELKLALQALAGQLPASMVRQKKYSSAPVDKPEKM